jgi:hypothetical protein
VRGLGDYVKSALEAVGLTRTRWNAVRQALGLKKSCGCVKRQDALNKVGDAIISPRISATPHSMIPCRPESLTDQKN